MAPGTPWVVGSPYSVAGTGEDVACFSVVELVDGEPAELVGDALLWGIDPHNRSAHLGLALRPKFRGRGFGRDIVRVLCHYGFAVRGLHRLQVETLADNTAMVRAATRAGFLVEGTMRSAAWVTGAFVDEVILGLLASEYQPD